MVTTRGVDNSIYRTKGHVWWDENENVATLRFFVNPVRFSYFQQVMKAYRQNGWHPKTVLDVGSGGGFLSEEFAKVGFTVTGIEPAAESLICAREHATANGLKIDYRSGSGEEIPFDDETFDIVLCCDVLEHVDDIKPVIGEVARVLRKGGIFFYDTINRTVASYVLAIKVLQEWRWTAQHEVGCHEWTKFIRPVELNVVMAQVGLHGQENKGISSSGSPIASLINLRRRVKGKISFRELGQRLGFCQSDNTAISYMGYAVKAHGNRS